MINIVFRFDLDNGKKFGTGHFTRALKICKKLNKKKKFKFYVLTKSNKLSLKILKTYFKNIIFLKNKEYFKKLFFLKENDILINDTPRGIEKKLYLFCFKNKIKIVSFDDTSKYSKKLDLVINSVFFLKKNNPKNAFKGFKYFVVDEEFKVKRKSYKPNNFFNILICSGGTDKKDFYIKVYKILNNHKNIKINAFIGVGVSKNNKIYKIKDSRLKLFINKPKLKQYFDKSHLAIVSGGFTMLESVITKTPTAVIKTYEHQKYMIKELTKLKLVNYLGNIKNINTSKLDKLINRLKQNKKDTFYMKKVLNNNILGPNGLDRVIILINRLINST